MTTEDKKYRTEAARATFAGIVVGLCILCGVVQWTLPAPTQSIAAAPAEVREAERLPHGWDVWAPPTKGNQTLVVLRIIDGDSVEAAYLMPVTLRIAGINAPELNTAAGKKSKLALESLLIPGVAQTWRLDGREKFGRTLADCQVNQGQETGWLSWWMVNGGWAVPYDGGKR